MAKNNSLKTIEVDGKTVTLDQDAINAALDGAVSDSRGRPLVQGAPKGPSAPAKAPRAAKNDAKKKGKEADRDESPISDEQRKFGEDCFNFKIDAKSCYAQSTKKEDESIKEYLRAINKKIYDETCTGGFSTNIQFRVTPQDWVNVSHIMDWYRARGFEVVIKDTTSSPYGKDVGTMNYNFTISWAVVG